MKQEKRAIFGILSDKMQVLYTHSHSHTYTLYYKTDYCQFYKLRNKSRVLSARLKYTMKNSFEIRSMCTVQIFFPELDWMICYSTNNIALLYA